MNIEKEVIDCVNYLVSNVVRKEYMKQYNKEYREKNKQIAKQYSKQYREKNKEKISIQQKEKYKKNRDKYLLKKREDYQKNKEKILASNKKSYEKNKARALETNKLYREKNKTKIKEQKREYEKIYRQTEQGKKKKTYNQWKSRGLNMDTFYYVYPIYLNATHCERCDIKFSDKNNGDQKCMDHCHATGMFRNVLCRSCNMNVIKSFDR